MDIITYIANDATVFQKFSSNSRITMLFFSYSFFILAQKKCYHHIFSRSLKLIMKPSGGERALFLDSSLALFYNRIEVNLQRKSPPVKASLSCFALFFILLFTPTQKALGQETVIKLKVVADQANIRLEPDISSIIIRQVPKGTILNATEKKEDWFTVQLMPKQGTAVSGYVHESLVIVIEPLREEKKLPRIQKKRPVKPKLEEEQQTSPYRFFLSIMGGGNYVRGGDLNLGVKGLADLYEDILGIQEESKIGSIHLGYVLGVEVSFPLSENLFWGIGAEHFQGKNKSQVDYLQGTSSSALLTKPCLRTTPINLFLSFYPVSYLYVKGGISYFFARYSYTYLFQADDLTQQWEGKSNAQGFGLSGSLGFSKSYSSNLSLFAEITGRLAKIEGFNGKETFQDSAGNITTQEGKLYLIQMQLLEDRAHSVLFIRKTRPNEAGVIAAKEAQIDLSGVSFKVGLRFHF